jgi:hypothetical protein
VTRARAAGIAAALLLAPEAGARELCRTRVIVEPESAWVGQQIAYRLQILRHVDVSSVRFARDLAFPSFRAEWLPGQSPDPAIADVGDHLLVFEERRALFPARAGELAIPPARIACVSASETVEVEVPAARVVARELPRDDAPADFRGVVGVVKLQAHLARERIALGESLGLAIRAAGAANLWDAVAPFAASRDLPGVDVHTRPSELERDASRNLVVQRSFAYDLVPRAAGDFTIPALRLPYFDPATERFAVAETAPLHFVVELAAATPAPAPRVSRARDEGASSVRVLALLVAALSLAMLVGIAAFAIALGRRRNRGRAALRAAAPMLDEASAAIARGDRAATARALAAALRAALEARVPGTSALTAEELARRDEASLRAAGEALRDLDRARFGADAGGARPLDVAAVRALIAAL